VRERHPTRRQGPRHPPAPGTSHTVPRAAQNPPPASPPPAVNPARPLSLSAAHRQAGIGPRTGPRRRSRQKGAEEDRTKAETVRLFLRPGWKGPGTGGRHRNSPPSSRALRPATASPTPRSGVAQKSRRGGRRPAFFFFFCAEDHPGPNAKAQRFILAGSPPHCRVVTHGTVTWHYKLKEAGFSRRPVRWKLRDS